MLVTISTISRIYFFFGIAIYFANYNRMLIRSGAQSWKTLNYEP